MAASLGRAQGVTRPAAVALLCAVGVALFAGLRAFVGGGDLSHFVMAGERFADPAALPSGVRPIPGDGYDGQFYYRLALDPWPDEPVQYGMAFDAPVYRHQRILLPALAHALSLGRPTWAAPAIVAIGGACLVALAWIFATLARAHGLAPAWGLLPPLFAPFLIPFARTTSELLAATLLAAAILASSRARPRTTSALLAFAVLARETAILAAAAHAWVALRDAHPWHRVRAPRAARLGVRAAWLALPFAVLAAWQFALWNHWGRLPTDATHGWTAPLLGLARALPERAWLVRPHGDVMFVGGIAFLFGFALMALPAMVSRPSAPRGYTLRWVRLTWFGWTGVLLCLPQWAFPDLMAFGRYAADWCVLGFAALLLAGRAPPVWFVLGALGFGGAALGRLVLWP